MAGFTRFSGSKAAIRTPPSTSSAPTVNCTEKRASCSVLMEGRSQMLLVGP